MNQRKNLVIISIVLITQSYSLKILGQTQPVPPNISPPKGFPSKPSSYDRIEPGYLCVPVSMKHYFTIVLLNDSTITVKTKIDISGAIHTLSWGKKEETVIIKPSETKQIYRTDNEDDIKMVGLPADTCWLFPVSKGKINTYSVISDIDCPWVTHIQASDNTGILPLTKENLLPMITNNQKATKFAKNGKFLKAIDIFNLK